MAKVQTEKKLFCEFPTGLRVLVVDNDLNILEIIKQTCLQCQYRVVTFSDAPFALNYVREKKYCFDVILVEVHMPNMDGFEFLKNVTEEINVPVIMMSFDNSTSAVMKSITQGACDYWLKPVQEKQIRLVWKHVAKKLWNEKKQPRKDDSEFACFVVDPPAVSGQSKSCSTSKQSDVAESDDYYAPPAKKTRVAWSKELHLQFVNAVMQIGLKNAQPKKILEVMKNPSLTREQISSHLQKYRLEMMRRSNGVTLQQNEGALPNSIESRGREGEFGRVDLAAFGDTSHVPYVALHPEVLSNNSVPKQDQWPDYSLP